MHLPKLIKVLQNFDHSQLRCLQKYVRSPYFQVYPPSADLLDYVAQLHPNFSAKKMNLEAIAESCENLTTYTQQVAASTRLLRTIEQFIAQEEWQKNETEVMRYQLKGTKELGMHEEFTKGYEKELAQLNEDPEQNIDTFYEKHLLTELSLNGFNARLNRSTRNDILPVVQTLDVFYAVKKLRYLCEALNRHKSLGVNYHDEHVASLLKILEPYTNTKHPYVYLFVNVYHMLTAESFEDCDLYYQLIKQFAERNGPTQTIKEAMGYAVNQTMHWNNHGSIEAGNEYLWWINWRMKHDLLLEKGKIMPVTFRNIISIAVTSKRNPSEIESLIITYSPFLSAEQHDTYLAFAKGMHQYSLKSYKKAIRFFLTAQEKEEVAFNCVIRRWQWMCLYECDKNDTGTLINHLLSFEKYLQRNKKELQHVYHSFELFVDYGNKLLKAHTHELAETNITRLQHREHFPGKQWFTEQFMAKSKKQAQLVYR